MYAIILKLVWPYVQRLLASQAADYIQKRREQRSGPAQQALPVDCPPCPPCPPTDSSTASTDDDMAESKGWFAMSGLLLGSAFGLMIYVLLRDTDSQSGE